MRARRRRAWGYPLRVRLLGSLAAVGIAASVAGLDTYGTFTSTTSADLSPLTAGTVVIALGADGTAANRLTVGATGLVPSDTVERGFHLMNTGNQDLASITLTTTASVSSLLDTDTTNGLQLVLEKCSIPWTEAGPPYTYTCGSRTTVLASRPVIGSNLALTGLSAVSAGSTDYLRATLTFPGAAGNSLQNLSSTITFSFTGTQRAGTSR